MNVDFFKGKRITVFGLGLHGGGVGVVKFLVNHGAKVIVTDIQTRQQLASSLEKLAGLKNVEYILGQHRREDFTKVDMVIKTPPAPWSNKHIKLALESNVPVETDSGLFLQICKNPIIGVTGTRGKTTTATLIYEILKVAGKNPLKVGIGQISVLDKLDLLKKNTVVVFEMSSWRLSSQGKSILSPHIAVFTNVYQDHMNYYKTMEDYVRDKKNIFLHQKATDFCVINADNEILRQIEPEINSQTIKFSAERIASGKSVYLSDGAIFLNNGIDEKKLLDVADVKMRGRHNLDNIMAAIGAAYAFGIGSKEIKRAILGFEGVSHRLEFCREVAGVKYFNDTTATSPDGAICGVNSFAEPIILIAGGNDKGLDFSGFGKVIAEKIKRLVLLKGSATEKLALAIKKNLPDERKEQEFTVVDSMKKAVEFASQTAEKGDVVLLSPGAASFGLFLNEFDRGNKFKEAVEKLK